MLARLVAVSGAHDLISFAEDKVRLIGLKLDGCSSGYAIEPINRAISDLNIKLF